MGGGGGDQSSTTTSAPWSGQQPYLKDLYQQATNLFHGNPTEINKSDTGSGFGAVGQRVLDSLGYNIGVNTDIPRNPEGGRIQYFPGSTVAGFVPEQNTAQNLIMNRAREGSPLLTSAQNQNKLTGEGGYLNTDTISGKYINSNTNPYLAGYVQKAYETSLPQVDTSAIQAGRYGSDAWANMKGRTMADISSNIYGNAYTTERQMQENAYQDERNRMMQAIQNSPTLAQADYYDLDRMAQVGAEKQAMNQSLIDAAREKWEFEQMEPWKRLAMYNNILSGGMGGVSQSVTEASGGK